MRAQEDRAFVRALTGLGLACLVAIGMAGCARPPSEDSAAGSGTAAGEAIPAAHESAGHGGGEPALAVAIPEEIVGSPGAGLEEAVAARSGPLALAAPRVAVDESPVRRPAPGEKLTPIEERPKEYKNLKDGSVLVWIPGGEFVMGSDDGPADERPAHTVKVEGFWLGKFEVTNAQFAAFMHASSRYEPMFWEVEGYSDPQQPVVGLTWQDADAYVDWAELRLPTEAEWEYAAAGGKGFAYPTATGAISHDLANYRGAEGKDGWNVPSPVGSFPPNPFGLYDMAGNAWEWTATFFNPYPYQNDGSREDGERSRGLRVMRGGSWHFSAEYVRTAHRHRFSSHLHYDYVGIRVAMSAEKPKASDDVDEQGL